VREQNQRERRAMQGRREATARTQEEKRPGGNHSERQTYPRRRKGTRDAILRASQTESHSKGFRDAKELDRDLSSGERTRIASQPLFPGETVMGPLSPGKRCGRAGESDSCRLYLDFHLLVAQELDAGPPMIPSTPITPEERR
jgi:hypothetical protein